MGILNTLRVRAWNLCSNVPNAYIELNRLLELFTSNGHNRSFVRKHLFYPKYGPKNNKEKLPKCFIPYHPVTAIIGHVLKRNHIEVVFKPDTKIGSLIQTRSAKTNDEDRTGVVYRIKCADCAAAYVGQTSRRLKTRFNEHSKASEKNDITHSALVQHICDNKHSINFEDTAILYQDRDTFSRLIKETIAIKRYRSSLVPQNFTSVQISPAWFDILQKLPDTR